MAFSNTTTAAAHSKSYPLTIHYGIPHGVASSISLIPLLEINGELIKEPLDRICDNNEMTYNELKQTIKAIPKNTDLLIVDSYALDEIWHKQLRPYTKKIMVIDDLADRQFDCDVLLNQNLGTQIEDYKDKVPNDCELLLSCDYALLRPEFSNLREKALIKRKNTKEIKNILISMGGSDITNKTYDILQEVSDDLNIVIILGGLSPHNKMIKNYAKSKNNVKVLVDADNISGLMFDADLAIGAGGSTSWERCCLGLPTLLYVLAENQRKIAENLEQLDAVKIVDNLEVNLQNILNNFLFGKLCQKERKLFVMEWVLKG